MKPSKFFRHFNPRPSTAKRRALWLALSAGTLGAALCPGTARADITGFSTFAPVNIENEAAGTSGAGIGYSADTTTFTVGTKLNGEGVTGFSSAAQTIGGGFQTTFTFTDVGAGGNFSSADGASFILQNDARGTAALGGTGGNLGYSATDKPTLYAVSGGTGTNGQAITSSAALELTTYQSSSGFTTGGAGAATNDAGVAFNNGDRIQVTLTYAGTNVTATYVDLTTKAVGIQNFGAVNLQTAVGNTALVGFGGGSGGLNANATVNNFKFTSTTGSTYTPLAVTGYNQDVIVEQGAAQGAAGVQAAISATVDQGTAKGGGTFYEQGYNTAATTTGLPHAGLVTSTNDASHRYNIPSAVGNNSVLINSASKTGTLTLTNTVVAKSLSFLLACGNGTAPFNVTVNHTNGTSETITDVVASDWFGTGTTAVNANGRVDAGSGNFDNVNNNNPRLFQADVALTDTVDAISSLTLTYDGTSTNAQINVFAVSAISAVPEPATWLMGGLVSAAGLSAFLRRRVAARTA